VATETITHAQFHERARQWENTTLRTELLLAGGAVVLAILGWAGIFRSDLAAIAVIGLGLVLGFQGGNVMLRYTELLYDAGATTNAHSAQVSRGITGELLAGLAGIVPLGGTLPPLARRAAARMPACDSDQSGRRDRRGPLD